MEKVAAVIVEARFSGWLCMRARAESRWTGQTCATKSKPPSTFETEKTLIFNKGNYLERKTGNLDGNNFLFSSAVEEIARKKGHPFLPLVQQGKRYELMKDRLIHYSKSAGEGFNEGASNQDPPEKVQPALWIYLKVRPKLMGCWID